MSGILVIAEHTRGVPADLNAEMSGAASLLQQRFGGSVRFLIVGADAAELAPALALPGVDEILVAQTANAHFDAAITEQAAFQAALQYEPDTILIAHSASGMAYASALAVHLGSGFAADVFALDRAEPGLRVTRSGYGSKVNIELDFPDKAVVVLTIRSGAFKPAKGAGTAQCTPFMVDSSATVGCYQHIEFIEPAAAGVDIGKADFILSIGRGIQDEKNIPRFAALADKLGATLGCSRPVADSGWLHKGHQVGLTGKVAANCKLYLALGISGAVQHLHGMKHVDTIVAINIDSNAPIFNVATLGSTVDLFEFTEALEKLV